MDLTFDEVRQYDFGSWKSEAYADEKIPSFQEFIDFCKENSVHPYIELKTTITQNDIEKVQNLLEIVSAAGMQKDVSWFSFSYNLVEMVKEVDPTADIGVVLQGGDEKSQNRNEYSLFQSLCKKDHTSCSGKMQRGTDPTGGPRY